MREWTEQDAILAQELGFGLEYGPSEVPAHAFLYEVPLGPRLYHDVGLSVWTLAEAGEPTACKALDIIEAVQPKQIRRLFAHYLRMTSKEPIASDTWVRY